MLDEINLLKLTVAMTGAGKLAEAKLKALLSAYSDAAQAVGLFAQLAEQVRLQTCTLAGNQSLTNGAANEQPTAGAEQITRKSAREREQ